MVFLANLVFNFHSGIYIATTLLLVNVYLTQNMKKAHFGPNLHRKWVTMGHAQGGKKNFFSEIKADHELSESFYFIKISYVLTEL